jgi:hypothetical protein
MSDQLARRTFPVSYLSLAVASLSMVTSLYQGWLQTENMATVTRDIARREQIRVCRDVIEAYFEAKLRIGLLADAVERTGAAYVPGGPAEQAAIAVSRIGAYGTFLANVEGEEARDRYTRLTRELEVALAAASKGSAGTPDGLFREADRHFAGMNEDCAVSSRLAAP